MAPPRKGPSGRRGSGRKKARGSYSSRGGDEPAGRSSRGGGGRGADAGGGRGAGRGAGRSGRGGPRGGGSSNLPIVLGLGGAAVILVVVLAIFLLGGNDEPKKTAVPTPDGPPKPTPAKATVDASGNPTPPPFAPSEVQFFNAEVDRIGQRLPEAEALSEAGFRAQNAGRLEEAQEKWRKAFDIISAMQEEANALFKPYATGEFMGVERADEHLDHVNAVMARWIKAKSQFDKYVK